MDYNKVIDRMNLSSELKTELKRQCNANDQSARFVVYAWAKRNGAK
jgi:hypothetical protein